MVWGCLSYYGLGKLVFIDGIMNSALYVNILANNLAASAEVMGVNHYTFKQDNHPKHTSKLAKHFFATKSINLLPWTPQSPNSNPIETLWERAQYRAVIKKKLKGKEKHIQYLLILF